MKDVPYIANWIYEHPGLDLKLKGIWIADPSLSYGVVQQEIPALRFVQVLYFPLNDFCFDINHVFQANRNLFPFNSSFMESLQTISDECGYTDYLDQFVTYPPKGQLPLPVATNGTFSVTRNCRIHSPIQREVTRYGSGFICIHYLIDISSRLNPAFDVYRVSDTWPNLCELLNFWSILFSNESFPQGAYWVSLDLLRNSSTSIGMSVILPIAYVFPNRFIALMSEKFPPSCFGGSYSIIQVQDAIHAPHINWNTCANGNVYIDKTTGGPGNDQSIPSTLSVLPNVIEKSVRTVIVHGLAVRWLPTPDYLSSNLLHTFLGLYSCCRRDSYCDPVRKWFNLKSLSLMRFLRNMTWNGAQGFQTPIEEESFKLANMGVYGSTHTERGLTCECYAEDN